MFRTFRKKFLPNPFDRMLQKLVKRKGKKILIAWNRGLGDIPLGLFAMRERIFASIPDAQITFMTRENLKQGFSMLEGVDLIIDQSWKRGHNYKIDPEIKKGFDLVIEKPSPTDWLFWQIGKVIPKLKWDVKNDDLFKKYNLNLKQKYVGVQPFAETNHGPWRNWPLKHWDELFQRLEKKGIYVLVFGFASEPKFTNKNVIDLRGKTDLFELLSIIKALCFSLVLPDSGIASIFYYLDVAFSIRMITLWADPYQGILKQKVASPNPMLSHVPLIASDRDLSEITPQDVIDAMGIEKKVLPILLAAGQGTRLGHDLPKGLFELAGKTLFEWICEKIPKNHSVAIMTSPLNHDTIVSYFRKMGNFGLDVHFFQQDLAPLLDSEKKVLELSGPNGNGAIFKAFVRSGLHEVFKEKKIDLVTISYIDNPLADPFDQSLIGNLHDADISVQCIEREKGDLMGALVNRNGMLRIVEYSELDPNEEYRFAYSGQLAFNFSFFCKMGNKELPIHWVSKKMEEVQVWKGEHFIFDVFPYAKKINSFCVNRKTHYAPIKNIEQVEKVEKILRRE